MLYFVGTYVHNALKKSLQISSQKMICFGAKNAGKIDPWHRGFLLHNEVLKSKCKKQDRYLVCIFRCKPEKSFLPRFSCMTPNQANTCCCTSPRLIRKLAWIRGHNLHCTHLKKQRFRITFLGQSTYFFHKKYFCNNILKIYLFVSLKISYITRSFLCW